MTGRTLKGRDVLLMLIAFFGVVIAANTAFIVAAVSSFPGEEREHAYAAGLRFNETVAARQHQRALGWSAKLQAVRTPSGVSVSLRMVTRDGAPLPGLSIVGQLRRPTHAGEDYPLSFARAGDGLYVAHADGAAAGAWDVRAKATGSGGEVFDLEKRVSLP